MTRSSEPDSQSQDPAPGEGDLVPLKADRAETDGGAAAPALLDSETLRARQQSLIRRGVLSIILGSLIVATVAAVTIFYFILTGVTPAEQSGEALRQLLWVNAGLGGILLLVILWTLFRYVFQRRTEGAGARLHSRLMALFSAVALIPTVIVAAFAAFTVNVGLESWFSTKTRQVLENSAAVAQRYEADDVERLKFELGLMVNNIQRRSVNNVIAQEDFLEIVEYFFSIGNYIAITMIDGDNNIKFRAWRPEVTGLQKFDQEFLRRRKETGEPLAQVTRERDQIIGITYLEPLQTKERRDRIRNLMEEARRNQDGGSPQTPPEPPVTQPAEEGEEEAGETGDVSNDFFLVAARAIDPQIVALARQTQDTIDEFRLAEANRANIQVMFASSYAVVALLLLLIAMWTAVVFANRIVSPIGRLVRAAERVRAGDMTTRVEVGRTKDEISLLGRTFNRMTGQLETQRDELVEANRQYDKRRRFIETVLSGVSAGVVGLDEDGNITVMNRSAETFLDLAAPQAVGRPIAEVLPEIGDLVRAGMLAASSFTQGEVEIERDGSKRKFAVRVTTEFDEDETEGYVVTFDDITELVQAQRMSAWADVARRIAHEIKNPLTPIQLSAERLRRKYAKQVTQDPEVFHQCTETIIRQVGDIGRMVDEFSSFARMPTAVMKSDNLREVVSEVVFLQNQGFPGVAVKADMPERFTAVFDRRQISQALINLIKNAAESVAARIQKDKDQGTEDSEAGKVLVQVREARGHVEIDVIDNGLGLPKQDRHRLTEPYMTTRSKGTGLGLAIVKKIMEDHGGDVVLEDAPMALNEGGRPGARIRLRFPLEGAGGGETSETSSDAPEADDRAAAT